MPTTTLPPIGTEVTVVASSTHNFPGGSLAEVTAHRGYSSIEARRGRLTQILIRGEYFWDAPLPPVGASITVKANYSHSFREGATAVVTRQRFDIDPVGGGVQAESGGDNQYLRAGRDFTYTAPVEEAATLSSVKMSFVEGAIERGEKNGYTHSGQVREALAELAQLEFIEPSTTVEDFKKRVVALAMDTKRKHRWCGEPEAFFKEIGWGDLVPVRKIVHVTYQVEVDARAGESDADIASRAATEAATDTDRLTYFSSQVVNDDDDLSF